MTACDNGHIYDDNYVTCPICASQRYDAGIQEYQREFLRKAKVRDVALRISKGATKHLMLYGADNRTFCGLSLDHPPPSKAKLRRIDQPKAKSKAPPKVEVTYSMYGDPALDQVCLACRIAVSHAFEEVA